MRLGMLTDVFQQRDLTVPSGYKRAWLRAAEAKGACLFAQ